MTSDETFPFLGHILEEATTLWSRRSTGRLDWGPVAAVDEESGREYHYTVTALNLPSGKFLVFQLDSGAERMREVLQKVRTRQLVAEQDRASHSAAARAVHEVNGEIQALIAQLAGGSPTAAQADLDNDFLTKDLGPSAGREVRSLESSCV
jgi:hypothetical protein